VNKALWQTSIAQAESGRKAVDWNRKISDHTAVALLVYTILHIYVTMGALKSIHGSILPYFGLVLLVAAIIPGCRVFEKRWQRLTAGGAPDEQLAPLYRRDRLILWAAAIGLPFVVTGMIMALLRFI
jgi:hypothetical protein